MVCPVTVGAGAQLTGLAAAAGPGCSACPFSVGCTVAISKGHPLPGRAPDHRSHVRGRPIHANVAVVLDPDVGRRLAFIRLLLARAEAESRQAPPFSTDSINRLHDVAEMFLALASQQHNLPLPKDFLGYWDTLGVALRRPLSYRVQMQKLNKARVNLKRYGVEPAASEVEASRSAVVGLLQDETPALFGLILHDVSLSNFVSSTVARSLVDSAQIRWAAGDSTEAFADLSEAFDEVIKDYEERKLVWYRRSVFAVTRDMTSLTPFMQQTPLSKSADFQTAVIESLKALDASMMLIGLGIDLRKYGKFKALVPAISHFISGSRTVHERDGLNREQADFDFCRDFIISTALHLAEFDYNFNYWELSKTPGFRRAAE